MIPCRPSRSAGGVSGSSSDPSYGATTQATVISAPEEGNSKEKSARIANASAASSRKSVGRKGGKSGSYDEWTVDDLRKRAGEIGIDGRSKMSKSELMKALRNH
jgi:hypothetical protein